MLGFGHRRDAGKADAIPGYDTPEKQSDAYWFLPRRQRQ